MYRCRFGPGFEEFSSEVCIINFLIWSRTLFSFNFFLFFISSFNSHFTDDDRFRVSILCVEFIESLKKKVD